MKINLANIRFFAANYVILPLRFMIVYEVDIIQQVEIAQKSKSRGFHLVTCEIVSQLPKLPKTGVINIF